MFRFFYRIGIITFSLILLAMVAGVVIYFLLAPQLPSPETLKAVQFQVPLRVFSAERKLIAEFGEKRRIPIEYRDTPTFMIQAILAAEDDRFFEHPGVDYQGIIRAAISLITTGHKAQGGSTITMQVARNFFLSREKTYLRKLNEIILALQIEQVLTKEEILSLYLNKIYLGKRSYGVAAAATVYYGKPIKQLTLPQFAMIAGLPKAPSRYNPVANPERALIRRNYVLRRMWEVGYISENDYLTAIEEPTTASYHQREVEVYAPFVAEMVRNHLTQQFGDSAYNNGYNVYTTIQAAHQQAANDSLQTALLDYDKRHGFRGAIAHIELDDSVDEAGFNQILSSYTNIGPLSPGLVISTENNIARIYSSQHGIIELTGESLAWARAQLSTNSRGKKPEQVSDVLQRGDIIFLSQNKQEKDKPWQLAQLPEVEGALISVSPYDGAITSLNGGFDYFQNKFNRVIQSRRQPGSGFKPFIYSAALEKGYTAASLINDAPVVFDDPGLENVWRPENYSGKFFGLTRLRVAITHSRNLVSIRLLRAITVNYAIEYAKRFGFDTRQMPHNLSLALGSGSASPWDMARAYAALANGGYRIEPYFIQRVEDSEGNIIIQAQPDTVCESCSVPEISMPPEQADAHFTPAKRIITAQNAYIMNSLLRDVVRFGTGRKALTLGRKDLAGKTGTTNDQVDAWFNGFNPELVAISWVGFDTPKTLGRYETGGRAALPMWINFMKIALKEMPEEPFKQPAGLVTVRIDPETGLLAGPNTNKAIFEVFRPQYVPKQITPTSDKSIPSSNEANTDAPPPVEELIDPF